MKKAMKLWLLLFLSPIFAFAEGKSAAVKPEVVFEQTGEISNQVMVEAGEIRLAGRSHSERKRAELLWEEACSSWRKEMRSLNRQNLLLLHCGIPELKSFKEANENLFRYESTAQFRIRVSSR